MLIMRVVYIVTDKGREELEQDGTTLNNICYSTLFSSNIFQLALENTNLYNEND